MPVIRLGREITAGGGKRAGLGKLAVMKERTWLDRKERSEMDDYRFLLVKMEQMGEHFGALSPGDGWEMGDEEALQTAAGEAGGGYEAF